MENIPANESNSNNITPTTSPEHTLVEHDQPPVVTNTEDDTVLKTPEEVLAELTSDDYDLIQNGDDEGNKDEATRTMVIAPTVDGSSVIQEVGSDGQVLKKRKSSNQVKDPPSGSPTCPECKREFATWKAAFGHMRKHPDRPHRGFFPPPTFSTVAPVPAEGDGLGDKISEGVEAIARELVFDLNRSIQSTAGSSAGGSGQITKEIQAAPAPAPAPAPAENEEGRRRDFDLNELPPPEEDDETEEK